MGAIHIYSLSHQIQVVIYAVIEFTSKQSSLSIRRKSRLNVLGRSMTVYKTHISEENQS